MVIKLLRNGGQRVLASLKIPHPELVRRCSSFQSHDGLASGAVLSTHGAPDLFGQLNDLHEVLFRLIQHYSLPLLPSTLSAAKEPTTTCVGLLPSRVVLFGEAGGMEVAEASSRDDNKRVEDARRARVEWLQRLRAECRSEEEFDTARSRPIWAELDATMFKTASTGLDSTSCSSSCASSHGPSSEEDLERVRHENRLLFQQLLDSQPPRGRDRPWFIEPMLISINFDPFFIDCEGHLELGKKIGGGGQADIHRAIYDGQELPGHVLKVFKSEYSLADLQRSWMKNISTTSKILREQVSSDTCCGIMHGTLMQDGRFAFVLRLYQSDLRKVIDHIIIEDKTHQMPPFSFVHTIKTMYDIACGLKLLHENGILHRDLKATNCLFFTYQTPRLFPIAISNVIGKGNTMHWRSLVTDFDSPEGVLGTRFWRAPEVLLAAKNKVHSSPEVWTEKVDVYSYAMTCYEVLTGCIPFEERAPNDYDGVIDGERPPLPNYVDDELAELVKSCWHPDPLKRPTFSEILLRLWMIEDRIVGGCWTRTAVKELLAPRVSIKGLHFQK